MEIRIMPINYSLLFGDAASQTFPATAAGTYTLSTPLAAGLYEITTDTSQSSFTLGLGTSTGYRFTGTIRGGKGYITVPATSNKIVIPAGMTYPANINIRLGSYTMMAAPTGASITLGVGLVGSIAWTNPSGSSDTIAYYRDGTSVSLATTTSPKTSVTLAGLTHGSPATALLSGKDANGVYGLGVEAVSSTNVNMPISGGTQSIYTSGPTTYMSQTFTGTGSLIVNSTVNIEYLIVAGGGPGGGRPSADWNDTTGAIGGGGAGGFLAGTKNSVTAGTYVVTVGSGGAIFAGGTGAPGYGTNGGNSSIAFSPTITASGGGAAGTYGGGDNSKINGVSGGSGGGAGGGYNAGSSSGGSATSGQGNAGGGAVSYVGGVKNAGGGGGGAGAVGGNGTANNPGSGGIGATSTITGTSTYYSGGGGACCGGGGSTPASGGAGGLGGGGTGDTVIASAGSTAVAGTINTGGGGGAKRAGGSGIVIVRVVL
jgi:hypothetical protein